MCPECRQSMDVGELQPNSMAVNLLSTMKTCCIYKANGCKWKGFVRVLAAHHKECCFTVTRCPFGCGACVDRNTLQKHRGVCEYRQVNDCACNETFRAKDRADHENACLAFLQQKLPLVRAQRDQANEEVRGLLQRTQALQARVAEQDVSTASSISSSLHLSLALLSILGQLVRPDGTLALALALLINVHSRDAPAIRRIGWWLPLASICVDAAWMTFLGPADLLPSPTSWLFAADLLPGPDHPTEDDGEVPSFVDYGGQPLDDRLALAYVAASVTVRLMLMLLHGPLLRALHSAAETAATLSQDAKAAAKTGSAERHINPHVPAPVTPALLHVEAAPARGTVGEATGPAEPMVKMPSGATASRRGELTCAERVMETLGLLLLLVSMLGALARPDAGGALALLVLCALPESRLYFSRVLLGASLLAIATDVVWLHAHAFPHVPLADLLTALMLPRQLPGLIDAVDASSAPPAAARALQLGLLATLVSLPLKFAITLIAVHTLCLPHVAEQRHFRFRGPAAATAAAAADANGEAHSGGDAAAGAAPAAERQGSVQQQRRQMSARARELEATHEVQLEEAKRAYTLCFLALLLAVALGAIKGLAAPLGSPEVYILALLAAYGCLRHSRLADSEPRRCHAVLVHTAALLGALVLVDGARLLKADGVAAGSVRWEQLDLRDKILLGCSVISLLLIFVLLASFARLARCLSSLMHRADGRLTAEHSSCLAARARAVALLGFCLAALVSCARRDADVPVFALGLHAISAHAEAEAATTLVTLGPALPPPPAERHGLPFRARSLASPQSEARARWAAELPVRRMLFCLAPDARRRTGGLLSTVSLLTLTSIADGYWGLLTFTAASTVSTASTASTASATSAAASRSGAEPASLLATLSHLSVEAVQSTLVAHAAAVETTLITVKLAVKLLFIPLGVQLVLLRWRSSEGATHAAAGRVTGIAGSGVLFTLSATLLLVASVSTAGLTTVAAAVPTAGSGAAVAIHEADAADSTDSGLLAISLATGPSAALAVLGCGLALGSGGRRLELLISAAAFLASTADASWLIFGPLRLSPTDLVALIEGRISDYWAQLPARLVVPVVSLLLQAPLQLGLCIGAAHNSCTHQAAGLSSSST